MSDLTDKTDPTDRPDPTDTPDPTSGSEQPAAKRRPDRRHRIIRGAVVVVLIVAVLWAADALARVGAESLLARNVADATGVVEQPDVSVRGFFFLPQVIRGAYSEVDIQTRGITSGPLEIAEVDSQLYDVRVPFHDVLVRDIRTVGIAHSDEVATLRYSDLNAYLETTGRPLTVSPTSGGGVQVVGSVDILNTSLDITADVELSVSEGQLSVTPTSIESGSGTIGEATRLLLAQRLRLTVPLGTLPFGHDLTAVQAGPDGLTITATGDAIVLRP